MMYTKLSGYDLYIIHTSFAKFEAAKVLNITVACSSEAICYNNKACMQ